MDSFFLFFQTVQKLLCAVPETADRVVFLIGGPARICPPLPKQAPDA
jgi:hypothetical protein